MAKIKKQNLNKVKFQTTNFFARPLMLKDAVDFYELNENPIVLKYTGVVLSNILQNEY